MRRAKLYFRHVAVDSPTEYTVFLNCCVPRFVSQFNLFFAYMKVDCYGLQKPSCAHRNEPIFTSLCSLLLHVFCQCSMPKRECCLQLLSCRPYCRQPELNWHGPKSSGATQSISWFLCLGRGGGRGRERSASGCFEALLDLEKNHIGE